MSEGRGTKVVEGDRLVWYAQPADEAYWDRHWADKVRPDYFEEARRARLVDLELGRVVLDAFEQGGPVLEAGCGAGWWVAALQAHGYDIDGIEYSAPLVARINDVDPELPVRCADATALDRPDGHYRSYLSLGVMEHRREGPAVFLAEAFRLLAPGGRAVISVPSFGPLRRAKGRLRRYGSPVQAPPFYQYGFQTAEFSRLVADAGFQIERACHVGLHRMLEEESAVYRWLVAHRGGERIVQRGLERLIGSRDGHMVVVVARRPA